MRSTAASSSCAGTSVRVGALLERVLALVLALALTLAQALAVVLVAAEGVVDLPLHGVTLGCHVPSESSRL